MSSDITTLESQLGKLRPSAPSAALLDRLEACAADVWQETNRIEQSNAESLATHRPAALPPALAESLHATLSNVEFPQESKIVPFPAKDTSRTRTRPAWLSAVALVALCGVLAALLVPVSEKSNTVATTPKLPAAAEGTATTELVPAGFRRGLSEASDEGVVWQAPDRAHRVLRVVYKDTVTMRDEQTGRVYQIEEPRVEYILVPAKID